MGDTTSKRKIRTGEVVSNKMDKTIVVLVERKFTHPTFKRIVKRSKKYKAHDIKNQSEIGDIVKIIETRPISKEKNWRLLETVKKAQKV